MTSTIEALEDAIMEKVHYWYDSQETDAPQEIGALRAGIREAIAHEEAQSVDPVALVKWNVGGLHAHVVGDVKQGDALYTRPSPGLEAAAKLALNNMVNVQYAVASGAITADVTAFNKAIEALKKAGVSNDN